MSFNLGTFSLRRKTTVVENPEEEKKKQAEEAKKTRSKATKIHPIANAVTDTYVDDTTLYKPQITRQERQKYWQELLSVSKHIKKVGPNSNSIDEKFLYELSQYPQFYVKIFRFISSSYWDQIYLNLFGIFLILCFIFYDRYGRQLAPSLQPLNAGDQLVLLPLLGMFFSQIIPLFGTVFYVHFCYDLVTLLAQHNFQEWAFVSSLIAQYIQFFHYSGKRQSHLAGHCKHGQKENIEKLKKLVGTMFSKIPYLKKYAKIDPYLDDPAGAGESTKTLDLEAQLAARKHLAKKTNIGPRKNSIIITSPKKFISPSTKMNKKQAGVDLQALMQNRILTPEEAKQAAEEAEIKRKFEEEEQALELAHPELFVDWTCLVCNTHNHARKEVQERVVNPNFGLKGIQYKTTYCHLIWESKQAKCKKCYTAYDYIPPEATAHLFPHNPKPYVAFHDYPPLPRVQLGLKRDDNSKRYQAWLSFWYGLTGNFSSKMMKNDWKLRKYITNEFPPLLRYELQEDEMYEIGEIIECKQQKLEFCRAKIIDTHPNNNTYDIKYDFGDELRFVPSSKIRPRPEKRSFAYRIEFAMILNVVYFPMGILLSLFTKNYGLFFLMFFLTTLGLFCIKLINFIQYCYNFYEAGILVILRLTSFYTLPIFFLMIFAMIGLGSASSLSSWTGLTALLILTEIFAMPVIYSIRASYCIIAGIIFLQASIGCILLAQYAEHYYDPWVTIHVKQNLDGSTTTTTTRFIPQFSNSALVPFLPLFTLIITFKYLRKHLHNIWDVCFVIRPLINIDDKNPFILKALYEKMKLAILNRM